MTESTTGDQARFERVREGMEPEACESAAGRGTTGAPALATLPHYASPGVGPMGAGQPADAGPTWRACAATNLLGGALVAPLARGLAAPGSFF